MKVQWMFLLSLVFAIIIAIFAVINVDSVTVNYLFGKANSPLILVILGSVLMGGFIVGMISMVKIFTLRRKIRALEKEANAYPVKDEMIEGKASLNE
ncbi:LapA family protein [Bacillus sp. MUM 13]|uniref:LapA family protein n=1 Tax=Bacillus sp. MUM 13 TaxID=1678001 RepID=UPI0008F5E408|nr:LapA family protein [Bacillus sp. MUM 13]OIK14291.1 hypothetical protein BIV59_03280 [Bacillus sp. MUM 13]